MIEKYVSNFELSKEMKELGFPQESEFYWVYDEIHNRKYVTTKSICMQSTILCSAYLVGELGEILMKGNVTIDIRLYNYGRGYIYMNPESANAKNIELKEFEWNLGNDTEANARATLSIYLKRKELI